MRIKLGRIIKPIMMNFGNSEMGFKRDRFIVDKVLKFMVPPTERIKAESVQVKLTHCTATLIRPGQQNSNRVILFNHGGAFCFSMVNFYIRIAHKIAERTGAQVLVPDYRLAPESPFPAALEDCRDAVEWLVRRGSSLDDIIVLGDSAGGNLSLNLAQELRQLRGLVLLSPWLDLTFSSGLWLKPESADEFVYPRSARRAAWLYVNGGSDWTYGAKDPERRNKFLKDVLNSRISPVLGPIDFVERTKVLLQVSGSERLLGDSLMFWERISGRAIDYRIGESSGQIASVTSGQHRMSIWPGEPHVWQIVRPDTESSKKSWNEIFQFIDSAYSS